jgi:hypothetical protein
MFPCPWHALGIKQAKRKRKKSHLAKRATSLLLAKNLKLVELKSREYSQSTDSANNVLSSAISCVMPPILTTFD